MEISQAAFHIRGREPVGCLTAHRVTSTFATLPRCRSNITRRAADVEPLYASVSDERTIDVPVTA
jgi:hypothetical protein